MVASLSISVITASTGRCERLLRLRAGASGVPQLLEFLVRHEHTPARLLEDVLELLVGDVDRLFPQRVLLLDLVAGRRDETVRGRSAGGRPGRRCSICLAVNHAVYRHPGHDQHENQDSDAISHLTDLIVLGCCGDPAIRRFRRKCSSLSVEKNRNDPEQVPPIARIVTRNPERAILSSRLVTVALPNPVCWRSTEDARGVTRHSSQEASTPNSRSNARGVPMSSTCS